MNNSPQFLKLIVIDVTQMSEDNICIGCITENGETIRPVLPYPERLKFSDLIIDYSKRHFIRPGTVLEYKLQKSERIVLPHTEDYFIEDPIPTFDKILVYKDIFDHVEKLSYASLHDGFGCEVFENKYTLPNQGIRSLISFAIASVSNITSFEEEVKFKITFTDSSNTLYKYLPITDYYFRKLLIESRDKSIQEYKVLLERIISILNSSRTILRIGLTRPFMDKCWLQIDGIFNLNYLKYFNPYSILRIN